MQSFISKMSLCQHLWLKQTMNFRIEDQKIFSTSFFDRDTVTSSPISLTTTPPPTEVRKALKEKVQKNQKEMLEKKNYTFTQVRSVFWLFHIGSQDERRPLDYTTRCFFSVSIFSSFFKNLNQSHPALYYTTRWFIFCLNFPQNII